MLSATPFSPGSNGSTVRGYLEVGVLTAEAGREDYYLEGGSAPAEFVGDAMDRLGIVSDYTKEDFLRLYDGVDGDGNPLTPRKAPTPDKPSTRVPGWDLTFSAPKSVSSMWAVADEKTQKLIEAAHDEAVRETLEYIQRNIPIANVGKGRKGPDGSVEVNTETAKLIAATFRHGTSRAQEPDLHSHAFLFNIVLRSDGKLMSLNSKGIFSRIKEIGAVYRIGFSHKLQKIDFAIEHDKQSFRVYGSDPDLDRDWSTRRQEIEEELRDTGRSGAKAAALANLKTREPKEDVPLDELKEKWRQTAQLYQFDSAKIESIRQIDYSQDKKDYVRVIHQGVPEFSEMLTNMTQFESALKPQKARERVFQALQGRLSIMDAETYVQRFFSSENTDLMHLTHEGEAYVTAREIYDIEHMNMEIGRALNSSDHRPVKDRAFTKGMDKFKARHQFKLSDEQFRAIKHITQGTGALALVEGVAGAGKSTALEAAMYIWQKQGLYVQGAAPQGSAAVRLHEGTGMPTTTVHKLLMMNEPYEGKDGRMRSPINPLTKRDVVVVDEAGTLDSRSMNRLLEAVSKAGAKLVLVGDTQQMQPVPAGGAANALKQEIEPARLDESRRQKTFVTQQVVNDIQLKQPKEALTRLMETDKLTIAEDYRSALRRTVVDWFEYTEGTKFETSIMIANTNAEVKDLNEMARKKLSDEGLISNFTSTLVPITDKDGSSLGRKPFAEGDLILFRKNDYQIDVRNGQRAIIKHIEFTGNGGITITAEGLGSEAKSSREITFNTQEYNTFSYGYAVTTNNSQGLSVDHASVLGGQGVQDYHATYVQMSRVKWDINLTLIKGEASELVDGPPTGKMVSYAQKLTKECGLPPKDFANMQFSEVRDFLNLWADESIEGQGLGPLYDVRSIIRSMKQENIKRTTLEFTLTAKSSTETTQEATDPNQTHPFGPEISPTNSDLSTGDWGSYAQSMQAKPNEPHQNNSQNLDDYDSYAEISENRTDASGLGHEHPSSEWFNYATESAPHEQAPTSSELLAEYEGTQPDGSRVAQPGKSKEKSIKTREKSGRTYWDREQVVDLLMRNPSAIVSELVDEQRSARHSKSGRLEAFGKNGSIKLNIDQNHRHYGKISDFERGYHGDLIGYFAFMTGREWYSALDELARRLNLSADAQKGTELSSEEKQKLKAKQEEGRKRSENLENQERDKKVRRAQRIWAKSYPLENTLANTYLSKVRGITGNLNSQDVRFIPNAKDYYEDASGQRQVANRPALIVAARDAQDRITSIQQIYLDPKTAGKHPEATVAKRTIGPVKGSAVLMHRGTGSEVIFTEGPETGASVAQVKPDATIYTSLGNNRNYGQLAYLARKHNTDTITFAADNDGLRANSYKSLKEAAKELHKEGIKVKVAMPPLLPGLEKTDFNDVLTEKGSEAVREEIDNARAMKLDRERQRDKGMSR